MPGCYYTTTVVEYLKWPTANYVNPVERTWLPAYAIAWQILATFFVFGRLYLRVRKRSFGLDDILIFVAWVCLSLPYTRLVLVVLIHLAQVFSIAFTATACVLVWDYQIGRHVWDVHPSLWSPALKVRARTLASTSQLD